MFPQLHRGLARLALLAPVVLPSCLARPSLPEAPAAIVQEAPNAGEDRAIVLIAIDGARWQEVFQGVDAARARQVELPIERVVGADELMPNIHRFARDRGVMLGAPGVGAPVVASGPNYVSMPGYSEMFTGRAPARCQDNACAPATEPTIFDEVRAASDRTTDVAVIASWDGIARVASARPSEIVLSAGRHAGANRDRLAFDAATRALLEDSEDADPAPGGGDFRPDAYTERLALAYLEARRPRMLFVGLGETDEYAHTGDYGRYLGALRDADAFVGHVVDALGRMGERGRRTTVIVTADHGRARSFRDHGDWAPESARVFLVAFGAPGASGAGRGAVPRADITRLADIAPTVRALLDVPRLGEVDGEEGRPVVEIAGL